MEQNSLKKGIWDSAAKAGLVFGIIASAYMFITQFMAGGSWPAILQMAVNALLWMLKFVGCIWLMMFYMKKLVKDYPQADNSSTFRFGCITAALSALIYAAISFANYAFISPEFLSGQMDAVMQQMAPMLDSNTSAEVERTLQNLPQITFFSNLIYCSLYGTIVAFAISRVVPSKDPFADYKPEDQ